MCVGLSLGTSIPKIRGMTQFSSLTLTLLVTRIAADDVESPSSPDELAVFTNTFHASSYLHNPPSCGPHGAEIAEIAILATQARQTRGNFTKKYPKSWVSCRPRRLQRE